MTWQVVASLRQGRRAMCEWCQQMVEPDQARTKVWHPSLSCANGTKNGPGMWLHDFCAIELLADNEEEVV